MNDLAIVCYSCDKNEEVWPIYKKCIDKYWPNHPNIYLLNETKKCDFINTICFDYDLDHWTIRIRKSLEEIKENYIIFMSDDIFLSDFINQEKLEKCLEILKDGIYSNIQFELSWHGNDVNSEYDGFKKKTDASPYKLSFLCGMWNKKDLLKLLEEDDNPWWLEYRQNLKGLKVLQVTDKKVLTWYNDGFGGNGAIKMGHWQHGVEDFLKKENIEVDFSKKGFCKN